MSQVRVSGNASGTGILTITSPNTNNNQTLTLPDNTGTFLTTGTTGQAIPKAALPAGSVLQVVQAATTTSTTTTSTSFVATNLSASITPTSSTSKILVICSLPMWSSNTAGGGVALYRNSSQIYQPSALDASTNYYYFYGVSAYVPVPLNYLDSPASTSAQTYQIYISSYSGSSTMRMPGTGGTNNASATMTLMEIAA